MEILGWLEVQSLVKDEWRSASMRHGEPFVMTPGVLLMPLWHAGHWDSQDSVHAAQIKKHLHSTSCNKVLHKQELKLY